MSKIKLLCLVFSSLIISSILYSCSSSNPNRILGKTTIINWIEKSGWQPDLFYNTDFEKDSLQNFINHSKNIKFTIFASSSCLNCSQTLPYFFSLLNKSKINPDNISLIGLDDYWESPGGEHKLFNINEIPVVFVTKNNKTLELNKSSFTNISIINQKLKELK